MVLGRSGLLAGPRSRAGAPPNFSRGPSALFSARSAAAAPPAVKAGGTPPRRGRLDGRRPATTIKREGPRAPRPGGRCPPTSGSSVEAKPGFRRCREPRGGSGGLADLGAFEHGGLDDEPPDAPALASPRVGADLAGEPPLVALLEEAGLR